MTVLKCEMCSANLNVDVAGQFATCEFCGAIKMLTLPKAEENPHEGVFFARWKNGYYYPGTAVQATDTYTTVLFLDGCTLNVPKEQILELEEGFRTLRFEGNWKNDGLFYKGVVSGRNPMVMNYNDGDVEVVQLVQLRGAKPGEATSHDFLWLVYVAGPIVMIVLAVVFWGWLV